MKIGDYVHVKNWGSMYSTCYDWFLERVNNGKVDIKYAIHYAYGDDSNYEKYGISDSDERVFEILYVDYADKKALITLPKNPFVLDFHEFKDFNILDQVFLINIDALEEIRIMTQKEIEKVFGCKIIIKGEDE